MAYSYIFVSSHHQITKSPNQTMPTIAIISSSVRTGRASHRVALYFKNYLQANDLATVQMLDLAEYNFPVLTNA